MWLIVIQVIALIAASMRGWGAKPIIMYGVLLAFSFVAGAVVGPDAMSCLQVLDYIIVGVFITFILGITVLTGVTYPAGFLLAFLIGSWFAGLLAFVAHIINLITSRNNPNSSTESGISILSLISGLILVGLIILISLAV